MQPELLELLQCLLLVESVLPRPWRELRGQEIELPERFHCVQQQRLFEPREHFLILVEPDQGLAEGFWRPRWHFLSLVLVLAEPEQGLFLSRLKV